MSRPKSVRRRGEKNSWKSSEAAAENPPNKNQLKVSPIRSFRAPYEKKTVIKNILRKVFFRQKVTLMFKNALKKVIFPVRACLTQAPFEKKFF